MRLQPPPIPTISFTPQAYEERQQELKKLTEERVEVMARLKTAREMGDLSENGAYQYAKFELGRIGRRLRDLRFQLQNGKIVNTTSHSQTVVFGCTVTVTSQGQTTSYLMVSQYESDPLHGKLSTDSPLGKVLMGKAAGDTVEFQAPSGLREYTIVSVK